jgi:hypothetical protein
LSTFNGKSILGILVNDACHKKNGKKHWLEILASCFFSVQNFAHMKKEKKRSYSLFFGKRNCQILLFINLRIFTTS